MSDTPYTIVNLKEVDDAAPSHGLSPNLETRFARKPLELEQSGVTYFRMAPGFREPFGHRHGAQEEVYVVLSGSARVKLDDEIVALRAWDAIRIAPGTMRCREAGANGAEMLLIGAPQAQGDGELVQGWWAD
jgi:mannose-6-phosphate isomerase-like protein (cupin superfamily)